MIKIIITTIILFIIFIIILLSFNVKIEYFNNILINKTYYILRDNNNNIIQPRAWYKFDIDGLLTDSSGNEYTLVNGFKMTLNSTDFVKGNASAFFDGANNFYIGNNWGINGNNFSICFWSKRNNNGAMTLFQMGTVPSLGTRLICFYQSDNKLNWALYGKENPTTNSYPDAGSWIHLCFVYNAINKTITYYYNGILIEIINTTNAITNFNTNSWIGYSNEFIPRYKGLMDDFRVYNFNLTEDQVFELYNDYKKIGDVIDTSTNCIANMSSSGIIKQVPDTNFDITNISAINKINDYIFNQSFNNAGINYTLTFSRYLDNDYIPTNLLSRNNKLTVFYDSINRDNYDQNGNYIGIFSRNTNIIPNLNNYPQKGDFIHIRLTSSSSNVPIKLKRYGFTADPQRPSRAPGTWALYAGTRLLEPSNTNRTLLVNNTTRLNNNSYCSANVHTYFHDISANETSANELLFIFTSLADFGNNNNSSGVLSFMNLLLFTS